MSLVLQPAAVGSSCWYHSIVMSGTAVAVRVLQSAKAIQAGLQGVWYHAGGAGAQLVHALGMPVLATLACLVMKQTTCAAAQKDVIASKQHLLRFSSCVL